ncbi:MAG: NADH-quinone oxidoreductase subunit D [Thermaerobacterales bacterium]
MADRDDSKNGIETRAGAISPVHADLTLGGDPESVAAALRRYMDGEDPEKRQRMTINFGPQHPSTHGVLRVLLTVEGETIADAQPDIGYLHRNWEKIVEGWTYPMVIPFSDRNDYLAPLANEQAVTQAMEKLMEIELTERGQLLRMLIFELQRIASHLIWFGTFALDTGAVTVFLHAFREREKYYTLIEKLTGARLLPGYLRVGGLRNDTPSGWIKEMLEWLDELENESFPQFMDLLVYNDIFIRRTRAVGTITAEESIAWGASGPVLRGSGVKWDLRKNDPFLPYDKVEFDVPVQQEGDSYARCLVRMQEILESIKIIRQTVDLMPEGPVMAKVPRVIRPPQGEVYHRVESPRGEIGVYLISDGGPKPYRIHWRSPCFVHLQMLPLMARGHLLADLVVIIGSIDIVLGEVDR